MAGTPCSQRFACKILGLRRNTARYRPIRLARYAPLEAALREIYGHHPQLGYRKVKAILNRRLRQEGRPLVGLRLVRRLRRRLCLCVPPPKRKRVRKGLTTGRVPTKAAHAHHVWTWDFLADITTVGGTFRILVGWSRFIGPAESCIVLERVTHFECRCIGLWLFSLVEVSRCTRGLTVTVKLPRRSTFYLRQVFAGLGFLC